MNGNEFERSLVETIQEIAASKGLKQKPLAESAWKDCKDPATKWRKIRNGADPRGLYVCDAFDLVEALGDSFIEVCAIAITKMREKALKQSATECVNKKETNVS